MRGEEVVPRICWALGGGAHQEEDLGRGCQGRGLPQRSSREERTGPRAPRARDPGALGPRGQRVWLAQGWGKGEELS